jgi:5'-deoxynucleotidase YfbR-like HD superfamily hydrolase
MTISETVEKILTDDSYLEQELNTIASYYHLKHTVRWAHSRSGDVTESVAEHVFGLHILIDYFYPLVDEPGEMNLNLIRQLASWHDMAEAFVGDMTTQTKTKEHEVKEKAAEKHIIQHAPPHLINMLQEVFDQYDARKIKEALFIKALDKIEPQFHLYFLSTIEKDISKHFNLGWDADTYRAHRDPYVRPFPIIKRFDDLLYSKVKYEGLDVIEYNHYVSCQSAWSPCVFVQNECV